MKKKVKMGKN